MASTLEDILAPTPFRTWTRQDLLLAVEEPRKHSIQSGTGAIRYVRDLYLQDRTVIHLPNIPYHAEYAAWITNMPPPWMQGDVIEVYLVTEQTWRCQRPHLTPQDIGMFIHEHGRPPLDCVEFFMPM